MAIEVKLQALKENVDSVEVNSVKVAPGDVVAKDQTLLEVQSLPGSDPISAAARLPSRRRA